MRSISASNIPTRTSAVRPAQPGRRRPCRGAGVEVRGGYVYEADKLAVGGLAPLPSATVVADRVAECPVNLEARVRASHPLQQDIPDRAGNLLTFEVEVRKVWVLPGDPRRGPSQPHRPRPLASTDHELPALLSVGRTRPPVAPVKHRRGALPVDHGRLVPHAMWVDVTRIRSRRAAEHPPPTRPGQPCATGCGFGGASSAADPETTVNGSSSGVGTSKLSKYAAASSADSWKSSASAGRAATLASATSRGVLTKIVSTARAQRHE